MGLAGCSSDSEVGVSMCVGGWVQLDGTPVHLQGSLVIDP